MASSGAGLAAAGKRTLSCVETGVGGGIRTHDFRNHNPTLYHLSYTHHGYVSIVAVRGIHRNSGGRCAERLSCGNRTLDRLIQNPFLPRFVFNEMARGPGSRRSNLEDFAMPDTTQISENVHALAHPSGRPLSRMRHNPARFQSSSTRRFTSSDMRITPGQRRVKPSPGHLRVASTPIFEP